jgi:HAD superfamily hydrolase (TIGR01549 family)
VKKICSFDVFDTCLTRKTAVPSTVFYEVSKKTFVKLGIISNRSLVEDFVAARVNAEQTTRQKSVREDVTLDEIWRVLIPSMGWQADDSLAQCELEAEEEVLVPIFSILQQVQAARQQECRIIFISDMYLPKEFIERQLVKHGYFESGDGLYVSGDVGKTKSSGNLFRHILAEEKVSPAEVLHIGDHRYSDYAVPRKLGIRAKLFGDAKLTRAETSLLQTNHDACTASRIAGSMRAFRLGCNSEEKKGINELASQFIAPFVMGFATWILQQAQKDGIRRLYFMSRDCQLLWKVAQKLSFQFGDIDCRYLYVSRQALFLPSADTISPEGMSWMRRSFEEPALKNLLAKIELKFSDVESVLGKLAGEKRESFCLKSEEDWTMFWNALNQEPIKTKIIELITARKETARQYFKLAGLFDEAPWAIVDLGWYLTCQQSLWKLLKSSGWQKQIKGYYLALKNQRVDYIKAGHSEALVYEHTSDYPTKLESPAVFSHQTLLEHIIGCADHPTVHHYEENEAGKIEAAFASSVSDATLKFCRELHYEVLSFVSQNQILVESFKDTATCRESLALLTTSFFKNPSRQSAAAIGELSAAVDQNGLGAAPIVRPLSLGKALLPLLPRRRPFLALWKKQSCFWPEGALAISPSRIRQLSEWVQRLANLRTKFRRILVG